MALRFETATSIPLFIYPQSGLAFYDKWLFLMHENSLANLESLKVFLSRYPNSVAEIYHWAHKPMRKYILSAIFNQGNSVIGMYFVFPRATSGRMIHYEFLIPRVRTLQRAVRQWARGKLEARRLALAMGMHDRLGIGSGIHVLGSDVLLLVINH